MKHRPIRKLAILGSVRQLHAVELDLRRYVGLLVALAGSTWIFWLTPRLGAMWIVYVAVVATLVAIFQPWHREFHLTA